MSSDNLTRTERRKDLMREQLIQAAMDSFLEVGYIKTFLLNRIERHTKPSNQGGLHKKSHR
ncbi:hypothetical protein [Bacillus sp. EB600]|uniref:hypothetical protein n=1 Tax=Bacillus sp. EB600 TaxID=2806345 RepID=UPI00210A150A|nr:hypothetical protein [Bacillus sp. EB600]MCQ6281666.1 hypothetical protein [Bacillus sp. EB600]